MSSDDDFPELPLFVIHDTVISDVLGEKEGTKYKDSALFITDYFLMRQALIGMDSEKIGITTSQVFDAFESLLKDKNTFQAIKDWIDETTFTEDLPEQNEKSSVYIYSHFIAKRYAMRTGRRVIMICNDDKIMEKLIKFYKESGRTVNGVEDLPFAIMNTDVLKDRLKKDFDKRIFDKVSDCI